MSGKKPSSKGKRKVNPDDFINYEEQFVEKGGGGGKTTGRKGKKTIRALKKQQRNQSIEQRMKDVEDSLKQVLSKLPITDNQDIHEKNIIRYCAWIEDNISDLAALDPSDCVITFTKSGGPGGQNVNKRETKVMIVHKPTNIRVESDQTRSQLQNKNLALEILQESLQDHLGIWKEYLNPNQSVDVELAKLLLD
ncbi:MAG TPA: peptide chain release factor-like protein [Chloroflexi bacterium]|nr:peptide chain release factor-like protein [Chloroflexota bacterium]